MRLTREPRHNNNPNSMLFLVLGPLTFITIFGFGALIGMIAILLNWGVKSDMVMGVIIVWLATLFGICFSLGRKASKIIDHKLKSADQTSENLHPQPLPSVPASQLTEFREPTISVTEHTTKTLDSVKIPRN